MGKLAIILWYEQEQSQHEYVLYIFKTVQFSSVFEKFWSLHYIISQSINHLDPIWTVYFSRPNTGVTNMLQAISLKIFMATFVSYTVSTKNLWVDIIPSENLLPVNISKKSFQEIYIHNCGTDNTSVGWNVNAIQLGENLIIKLYIYIKDISFHWKWGNSI